MVIAILTCLVAWQSRRSSLTPTNVSSLTYRGIMEPNIPENGNWRCYTANQDFEQCSIMARR